MLKYLYTFYFDAKKKPSECFKMVVDGKKVPIVPLLHAGETARGMRVILTNFKYNEELNCILYFKVPDNEELLRINPASRNKNTFDFYFPSMPEGEYEFEIVVSLGSNTISSGVYKGYCDEEIKSEFYGEHSYIKNIEEILNAYDKYSNLYKKHIQDIGGAITKAEEVAQRTDEINRNEQARQRAEGERRTQEEDRNRYYENAQQIINNAQTQETARVEAEQTRVSNEEQRQAQEILRANGENLRDTAEAGRISVFNTLRDSFNELKSNIRTLINNVNDKISELTETKSELENTHNDLKAKVGLYANAEEQRKENEQARQRTANDLNNTISTISQKEEERQSSEQSRENSEQTRNESEHQRISNEETRITNENVRKQSEIERHTKETQRISAETTRSQNEETRISNEETRTANEQARINKENLRIEAENERDRQFKEWADTEEVRLEKFDEKKQELNTELDSILNNKKESLNTHYGEKIEEYNDYHRLKLDDYNSNHTSKLRDYNNNHNEKIQTYNENVKNKLSEIKKIKQEVVNDNLFNGSSKEWRGITIDGDSSSNYIRNLGALFLDNLKLNDEITISAKIEWNNLEYDNNATFTIQSPGDVGVWSNAIYFNDIINTSNKSYVFSKTIRLNQNNINAKSYSNFGLGFSKVRGGTFKIKEIKIEKGNIGTT